MSGPFPTRKSPIETGQVDGIEWATVEAPLYGAVNGYVRVPEGHPWFGLDYEAIDVEVHGGLTYGAVGIAGHWIGFDTLHGGDIWPGNPGYQPRAPFDVNWDADMVARETKKLAAAVAAEGGVK
ncbi:Uncharacterised protein [Mycobacteroides abscessus subsp. bolletii]|uniref:hypothetical protein n=1 Tax=Mycobacteroides abscessus TaxID=36809 RepID=UPI0009A5F831|nr:hypothetical protein [Mycobacteroides abscessus]SLF32685.1 Uncharacterised protein [Mycobacteroides abscessus subsp. bolletii]